MIDRMNERLRRWADWASGGRYASGLGYARCAMSEWIPCGTVVNQTPDFNQEAYETDKAVRLLPTELNLAVIAFYLKTGTAEQRARDCRVSTKTMYVRVDQAHQRLEEIITANARKQKACENYGLQR